MSDPSIYLKVVLCSPYHIDYQFLAWCGKEIGGEETFVVRPYCAGYLQLDLQMSHEDTGSPRGCGFRGRNSIS